MRRTIFYLYLLTIFVSCGVSEFAAQKKLDTKNTSPVLSSSTQNCSSFTLIKPQVDFLFLWDNSTSSIFINNATKTALENLTTQVSLDFDFHMLHSTLLGTGNADSKLVASTTTGLSTSAINLKINQSTLSNSISNFPLVSGSSEAGLSRTNELLNLNTVNGVFRQNAYLIVVIMSNEDDTSWVNPSIVTPNPVIDSLVYRNAQINKLLCLRGSYTPPVGQAACTVPSLNNAQMRFISIVSHNAKTFPPNCGGVTNYRENTIYKLASKSIYNELYNGQSRHESQTSPVDSYNICDQANFVHLFDGINQSIKQILLKHTYNYWPVASAGASAIDPNEVQMFKDGNAIAKLIEPVTPGQSGFSFTNTVQTQNTRILPTIGEAFTGYLVKLYGSAQVVYPECVRITTKTPKEYYGFINLSNKPILASIQVKINGQIVSQSTTNGWELIQSAGAPLYHPNQNIKIKGPGIFCPSASKNYCPGTPALNKSGYMIKLNGSAVYSNGATISVTYDPAV